MPPASAPASGFGAAAGALPDKAYRAFPAEVAFAARIVEAMPDGTGAVMLDGKMQDDATWKQAKVIVDLAKLVAAKDPELGEVSWLTMLFCWVTMLLTCLDALFRSTTRFFLLA